MSGYRYASSDFRQNMHTHASSNNDVDACSHQCREEQFRCIGRGTCGTVWAVPDCQKLDFVYKTGRDSKALAHDFELGFKVYHMLRHRYRKTIDKLFGGKIKLPSVPEPFGYNPPAHNEDEDGFLKTLGPFFPAGNESSSTVHSAAIALRRIHSLPGRIRSALINYYFDPAAHASPTSRLLAADDHCLMRLYFGANDYDVGRSQGTWRQSLRNFELHLNLAQDLMTDFAGEDPFTVDELVKSMATGLAVLHWGVRCDAMNVEWVLGAASPEGEVKLWILDFDKVREVTFEDEDIVEQLLSGVVGNEPYFPVEGRLHELFVEVYLQVAKAVLEREDRKDAMDLPAKFVKAFKEALEKRKEIDEDDYDFFEHEDADSEESGGWDDCEVIEGWGSDDSDDDIDDSVIEKC